MKIALIQMNSGDDKAANLEQAEHLANLAYAADTPDMIALPEMFHYVGGTLEGKLAAAEPLPEGADDEGGEAYRLLRDLARRHGVFVHGGSLAEKVEGTDRLYNTTVAFDRDGTEIARYRKIHLFDVVTPDGRAYKESATIGRGGEIVTYGAEDMTVGCAICYDLRFPELFGALADKGAEVIMLPSAFTLQTGKDHWEVLIRARAIETQTYIVAPAQWGEHRKDGQVRSTYGHTLVADPWGHVVAKARDGVGYVTAEIDRDYLDGVRERMPVRAHRVL